jgi:hypothetical protein
MTKLREIVTATETSVTLCPGCPSSEHEREDYEGYDITWQLCRDCLERWAYDITRPKEVN